MPKHVRLTSKAFTAAVVAGCERGDTHLRCSYPDCTCKNIPKIIAAAFESVGVTLPKAMR